jgi:hypothetical protein
MQDFDDCPEIKDTPSFETIKKITDDKRLLIKKKITPEAHQKRLDNLAKAREVRANKLSKKQKQKPILVVEDDDNDDDVNGSVIEILPKLKSKQSVSDIKSQDNQDNQYNHTFSTLFESINNIKDLIYSQNNVINEVITTNQKKNKPRSKPKPKPPPRKTLDLTISDNDIDNIINAKPKPEKPSIDPKLQAFLDAFKR